jgi:hypothetical protein
MSKTQVVLTPDQKFQGMRQNAFNIVGRIGLLIEFYQNDLDDIGYPLTISREILSYLRSGFAYLGKDMPYYAPSIVSDPEVHVPLDLIFAKLVHYSANFFSIVLTHRDTWEDNYLDYDLFNLFKFISHYTEQELRRNIHGPSETISYPENYSGNKANP